MAEYPPGALWLSRLTVWLLPRRLGGHSIGTQCKARFVVVLSVSCFLCGSFFAALLETALDYAEGSGALAIACAVAFTIPIIMRFTGSLALCGRLSAANLLVTASYITLLRTGLSVASMVFLLPIPLIVGYLVNRRSAVMWSIVVLIVELLLYIRVPLGFSLRTLPPISPAAMAFVDTFALLCALALIVGVTLSYDTTHRVIECDRKKQANEIRRQMIRIAEAAARSEMATGLIHDIGNILNSINVSRGLMERTLNHSTIERVERALELLNEHQTDLAQFLSHDQRGKVLPEYLYKATESLKKEHVELAEHLRSQHQMVALIAQSISAQQSKLRTGDCDAITEVNVGEALRDALLLQQSSISRHKVHVENRIPDDAVCQARANKHRLIHVFVNLIKNATESMRDKGTNDRKLTIDWHTVNSEISLIFADNGHGIAAKHIDHILTYGFTTKADGHGYGLHYSLTFLKEIGGDLRVHSPGEGEGATFTVVLPVLT